MNIKQEQADYYERKFETFCGKNKIKFIRLDGDKRAQKKFLKNQLGKSPDLLCQKNSKGIFVEIKTHTLLTNDARDKTMAKIVQAKRVVGLSGTTIFSPFDPTPELKIPFESYLRVASKKFKNIKDEYNFPKVLLLDGIQIVETDIYRIFLGADWDVDRNEYVKKYSGLLNVTGSNVSAIVYWVEDLDMYKGIANPKARIPLLEADFEIFFEMSHS